MTALSFLLAAFGFITLIVLHELGHFTAAKAVGMRVERFSLFFPPLIFRKRRGETEYAIGAVPLGGYVKISGMNPDEKLPDEVRTRAYYAQPVWKRIVVIAAGPLVNLVLAFLLLVVFFWQIGAYTAPLPRVGEVEPGLPAAEALEPGDRIIAVDGERGSTTALSEAVADHTCPEQPPTDRCEAATPATFLVERDGERLRIEMTPVYDAAFERTRVGFEYVRPRDAVPLGTAMAAALDRFWLVSRETVKLPLYVFDAERREDITGLVGSYEITRQTILDEIADTVGLLALISLALAIINLFPFLPLDGGHIFWAVVEKLRRKPVSYATMERAGVVGFMLVMMLFLIGFTNDIGRLTGEGFENLR